MAAPKGDSTLFSEQKWRGNKVMPAPNFSQPNTGVASDIGESIGNMNRDLGSLRVKSDNETKDLNSGIGAEGE